MTNTTLQTTNQNSTPSMLEMAGQYANHEASRGVFADYRERKSANTLRRQGADLALFGKYLADAGVPTGDFANDADAWVGVTWGIVEGFKRWMLAQGYAVGSVNVRLSTVKAYAKLALKAGVMPHSEYAMIRAVDGYSHAESKHIDAARNTTRVGSKKSEPKIITREQSTRLKTQPDTPQGRRDALLMCLLLDHGLRVGEVAILQVSDLDLQAGELKFFRPKVDRQQTHRLERDTLAAARAYMQDAPEAGALLRESNKHGTLEDAGMSVRALTARVRTLGRKIGIDGLSAHDCRHYWASCAARNGTPIDRLQDAGGWSSPAMPLRYVENAKIANEGVRLE